MILFAAKPAPDLRQQQIELAVCQLHPQTLSRALRESHKEAFQLRILDEALWAEFHGVGEDVGIEVDKGCSHANGSLLVRLISTGVSRDQGGEGH